MDTLTYDRTTTTLLKDGTTKTYTWKQVIKRKLLDNNAKEQKKLERANKTKEMNELKKMINTHMKKLNKDQLVSLHMHLQQLSSALPEKA